jgi:UDP-galactopyranose mutase
VGEYLYHLLFEHYTYKQWNRTPAQLDKSILERIPVRNNWDTRYFTDRYQVLPKKGYTHFCHQLLDHPLITTCLSTDFIDLQQKQDQECCKAIQPGNYTTLVYTGPIDRYFSHVGLPPLEYRSIHFDTQHVPTSGDGGFAQSHLVINEPSLHVPYTRSVEYKHLPMNVHVAPSSHSVVVREYTTDTGEPYYPILNEKNIHLYQEYKKYADQVEQEQGVIMLGRLANYKYIDMHVAIRNALDVFKSRIVPMFEASRKSDKQEEG